jgi:hypothetical protein
MKINKFEAETDEDRPKIDDTFENSGKTYEIKKVDHVLLGDIINDKDGKNEPQPGEYEKVLMRRHKVRPAVYWVLWVNEKK